MTKNPMPPDQIAVLAVEAAQAAQRWAWYDIRSLPLEAAEQRDLLLHTLQLIQDHM